MALKNRVCEILGIEKPVIQGPMVWLTDARLIAAIGNAGGMGCLGPNAGQTIPTPCPLETAERMREEIRKVKALSNKPFAVNLIPDVPERDPFTEPMLKVIYEEKVPAVVYTGPCFPDLFAQLKENNVKIIFRDLNPSVESAQLAEKHGADIIVATGFDEGGTLPNKVLGTFSIVPMIVDAVKHTPVMAAGGISDSRTAQAAFALGAEGLFCGSVFLPSEECRMAENVKAAMINSSAADLLLFRTMPAYYRSLPGDLAHTLVEMDREGASNEEIGKKMGGFANIRIGMLEGDMNKGYVALGTGISSIRSVKPVHVIIEELTAHLM